MLTLNVLSPPRHRYIRIYLYEHVDTHTYTCNTDVKFWKYIRPRTRTLIQHFGAGESKSLSLGRFYASRSVALQEQWSFMELQEEGISRCQQPPSDFGKLMGLLHVWTCMCTLLYMFLVGNCRFFHHPGKGGSTTQRHAGLGWCFWPRMHSKERSLSLHFGYGQVMEACVFQPEKNSESTAPFCSVLCNTSQPMEFSWVQHTCGESLGRSRGPP